MVSVVAQRRGGLRDLVARIVSEHGYQVRIATAAGHALEQAGDLDQPIDLLLTDVVMPEMSGRELADRLLDVRRALKVLFMSGYTGDDVLARSLLPPTAPFIQKPFAPEELVARVRQLLAGGTVARH